MEYSLHIPTFKLLEEFSLDELIEGFSKQTGRAPSEVVVEAFSYSGPNFPSRLYRTTRGKFDVKEIVEQAQKKSLRVWLSFDLGMSFAASNANHIVDTLGDSSRRCCINTPGTRRILAELAKELGEQVDAAKIHGIVFPLQDLWPMGATGQLIEITCVCASCRKIYDDAGLTFIDEFSYYPSAPNLALKNSGTGISHINSLTKDLSPETLVERSHAQQMLASDFFDKLSAVDSPREHESWNKLVVMATQLLEFIHVREKATLQSISEIATRLKSIFPNARTAGVVEGAAYDWTGGYFLTSVASCKGLSEIWAPPSASPERFGIPARYYCSQRARYTIDQLAHHLEMSASSFFSGMVGSENRGIVDSQTRRIAGMVAAFVMSNPGDFVGLEEPGSDTSILGAVVPAFNEATLAALTPQSAPVPSQDALIQGLLDNLRSSAGGGT